MSGPSPLPLLTLRGGLRRTAFRLVAIATAAALVASCSELWPGSRKRPLVPAGQLLGDQVAFQLGVYYLPRPERDPLACVGVFLAAHPTSLKRVAEVPKGSEGSVLSARLVSDVKESYPPPDATQLKYFGRGLSDALAQGLAMSEQALVMDFKLSARHRWSELRIACELASSVARDTGGLVWDEETREVFTPDAWDGKRLATWTDEIPDVSRQIVIHAYKDDAYVRAITLGMAKLGLPDIVVQKLTWSSQRNVGILINLLAQAMAEGAALERRGVLELRIRDIRNPAVREPQVKSLMKNAAGTAELELREAPWEEGDPQNRLVEIGFDRYPGDDLHARQESLLSALFGSEDSITRVQHEEELLAASRRAREKLPALRAAFRAGLAPGEFIMLKAPFATPTGGREWMWVEVVSWTPFGIKGVLKNDPFEIPELRAGQLVEVSEKDVFDYIRGHPDGTQEGNETRVIIERQSAQGP